jgi:DNA gyrase subunit B
MADNDYDASKIVVLEGAQGIRKRPAMYIGSTGPAGALHLLYEVVDNSVDEAMAGFCKNIYIRLTQDDTGNIAEVSDDGRGIPVGIMEKYGKSALEVIMTTLHKGAKFENDVYKVSGGLHGVGLTVVNALSEFTIVTVRRDGKEYRQSFSRGLPTGGLEIIGEAEGTGTTIRFKPDAEIFSSQNFDSGSLKERLRDTVFLNPGISITLVDERFGLNEEEKYYSEKGVADFIAYLNKGKEAITEIISGKKAEGGIVVEFAIQYNTGYEEKVESFVNTIRTDEGGTHLTGFHSALTKAVSNYISRNKASAKQAERISGEDVREGLAGVVSVMMQDPEFEGQTKEKLGNIQVKALVESCVYQQLSRYFEEHPQDIRMIIEKASSAANARESARKARELARKKSIFDDNILPGKLTDCIESDPERTELFIVEGESAGGSSKQGRDKKIQAVLPLRGKILNVEKASSEKIFDNAEIKAMIAAFGTGINESFNPDNIRYRKIIIMTDADVDGSHIRTLLLTFFYRYMKRIIELGYVYIAQPPLFRVSKGKDERYCYSEKELDDLTSSMGKVDVQRYKGLGEMNQEQLWETTMNPDTRILKQVGVGDAEKADELFTILMGIDVSKRRKFLHEHAEEVSSLDI